MFYTNVPVLFTNMLYYLLIADVNVVSPSLNGQQCVLTVESTSKFLKLIMHLCYKNNYVQIVLIFKLFSHL